MQFNIFFKKIKKNNNKLKNYKIKYKNLLLKLN